MKHTPLYEQHVALGAKMADFAGYAMPIVYTTIREEHMAVREKAGLFDVSHMGEFFIYGPQATEFLNYMTSNDVSTLNPGDAQYSCLPNRDGGIVDDLIIYRLANEDTYPRYMLVVNAANIDKDYAWLASHNRHEVDLVDHSDRHGLLALQGPRATEVLQPLVDRKLNLKYYTHGQYELSGVGEITIAATGYTGSGGYELYIPDQYLPGVWDRLMPALTEIGGCAAGLGARDTLRLEMGYCLYGQDITDHSSPLEAGLGWITKLKAGDFIGRDILLQQKESGLQRKLVGLRVDAKRVPRSGYAILNEDGEPIGEVTSGGLSPMLDIPIALGYVNRAHSKTGTEVSIDLGRKQIQAEIVRPPFVEIDA